MSSIMTSYETHERDVLMSQKATYNFVQGRWADIPHVVKQIAIRAELTDDHNRCIPRIFRNANPELIIDGIEHGHTTQKLRRGTHESNDVWMVEPA